MLDQGHADKRMTERDYWLNKLAGNPVKSTFPYDKKNRKQNERRQEKISFEFDAELCAKLLKFSNNSDLRMHILLMAGLAGLLEKYSYGEQAADLLIGAPIYKQEIETEFINSVLILRILLTEKMTFKNLLMHISQITSEANENVNYPMETLLYQLGIPYSPKDDFPLFDIAVLLENIHDRNYIRHIFPNMVFSFLRQGETITGELEYNALLFDKSTAARIAAHLITFLRNAAANLDDDVTKIAILSPEEKKQILFDFNTGEIEYPAHKTLPELFAEQVKKNPTAAAVTYEDEKLSYSGLQERANRLACILTARGAGPDKIAALMVDRSIEMIVAILAVLKAGAAYLPINPEHPEERIRYILKDSQALLLLTQTHYLELSKKAVKDFVQDIEILDLQDEANYEEKEISPVVSAHSANLAYVIYTSGSTGEPKGVMVEHRNVSNLVYGLFERIYRQYNEGLRVCLVAPYVFDASVQQIFAALLLGHHLHVVPENTRVDGAALLEYLEKYEIHISDGTPTHIHLILENMLGRTKIQDAQPLSATKHFIIGGEALPKKIVERFFACFIENCPKITNVYGPAECCVDSTSFEITRDNISGWQEIPLGKPMPNESVYILDSLGRVKPIGVTGELCISGAGVSRGYLKREELTASKFIANPFLHEIENYSNISLSSDSCASGGPPFCKKVGPKTFDEGGYKSGSDVGARRAVPGEVPSLGGVPRSGGVGSSPTSNFQLIYRTGDLARWLPDGNLEFLGRLDFQVKIRGLRIELGEIENQLMRHQGIKEAVVLAREDDEGEKYLCAYIAGHGDSITAATELRRFLSATLPDYMIPAFFLQIEEVPLTANGKVDRRILNAMEIEMGGGRKYAAPTNDTEKKLTGIWSEVLRVEKEKIGIDDNFFELGGHSLKATVQIARIQKELAVKVPLAEVFNSPTVRELSEYIGDLRQDTYTSIKAVEKMEYYPLSSAQRRLFFLQQLGPELTGYNVQTTLMVDGDFPVNRVEEVFRQLIGKHENFRTSFRLVNGTPVQLVHSPENIVFAVEDYETVSKNRNSVEITKETAGEIVDRFVRPFDLSRAPLLRAGVAKFNEKNFLLMVDQHHIISDGVSDEILREDFYRVFNGGTLIPLRIQYKDYACRQIEKTGDGEENIKRQEKYWLESFSGEIPVLNLPADYQRPPIQSFAGGRIFFDISREESRALKEIETGREISLYMQLLAIFNVMLAKLSGQEDIVVGSPAAGRGHSDLERVMGMFVNTLTMRNFPSSNLTFREFLGQVRDNTLQAFENQDYQFEDLIERVEVKRDLSRNPLFDVMLVLQNMVIPKAEELPPRVDNKDLKVNPYRYENKTAKFDLTLYAKEVGEQLSFTLEYCTALFEAETVRRFIDYFKTLVSSVLADPGRRIGEIEIIPDGEKELILQVFNDTNAAYPAEKTIHSLFEEQVERTPENTALIYPETRTKDKETTGVVSISYREFNRRVSELAALLIKKGMRSNMIAAVMIERSIEMMTAIFAVIKAGGAYLPISPDYPTDRKKYILRDSGASFLLTAPAWAEEIEKINIPQVETLFVETQHLASQREKQEPIPVGDAYMRPDDQDRRGEPSVPPSMRPDSSVGAPRAAGLAYIIYTSGSTGNPKGVMTEHSALINRLNWMQKTFPIDEQDTLLQKTPFTFDVSVWEIFWWSLVGAKLCLLEPGGEKEPSIIARSVLESRVTLVHFVPSMLHAFLDDVKRESRIEKLASLKQVVVSGEALAPAQVKLFNETLYKRHDTRLANLYGPTEAAIDVSCYMCSPGEDLERVPIGKPIDNIRLLVLDREFKLQPIGGVGELCIAGAGLARGYLNRPELTIDKFVKSFNNKKFLRSFFQKATPRRDHHMTRDFDIPENQLPVPLEGARAACYKTGDLARWLPDGNLEFLGRMDHQVKIRGLRIELGEIESRLLQHDEVKEAVVLSKENTNGANYLCAYIVQKTNPETDRRDLIHQIRRTVETQNFASQREKQEPIPVGDAYMRPDDQDRRGGSSVPPSMRPDDQDRRGAAKVCVPPPIDSETLHSFLSQSLPDYMIPAFFVFLEKIPLTANGKVDRKVLPEPEGETGQEYTAPENETQEKLVRIWQDVLRLERVGIKDKYFHVGGDSILAIKLLSIINAECQSNLKIVDIFSHDTIEKLASRIGLERDKDSKEDKEFRAAVHEIDELKSGILAAGDFDSGEIEDIFPMSDIEKGMVFYSLKDPRHALYHDQFVYQLKYTDFRLETFRNALDLLVEKHSILRTSFNVEDFEESIHIIYRHVPVMIAYFDIAGKTKKEQETIIKEKLAGSRKKSFNITTPPLWRMTLFSTGSDNICLIWEFHHAILDGWSNASFMTELHNTYMQLREDAGFTPGELKSSYKNFIIEQVVEKRKPERIDFWNKELEDYKRIDFSGLSERAAGAGSRDLKQFRFGLDTGLKEELQAAAVTYNTSLQNMCLAAYIYMLAMLTYDNDILAGLVSNNRPLCEDGEKVLGCFLNTVPLRFKIPASISWKEFIGLVDDRVVEIKRNERISFFEILRIIGEQPRGKNPLFDTIFNYVDFHVYNQAILKTGENETVAKPDQSLDVTGYENTNTLFDFNIITTLGEFLLYISYSSALLSDDSVRNLCSCYKSLLEKFIHEPGAIINKEELITPVEKEKLLYTFNNTGAEFPGDKTIAELFAEQVLKTPDNTAIIGPNYSDDEPGTQAGMSLTYRELDDQSGRLALSLHEKGFSTGSIAAIMVERSIEMMTGLFAILKAGGAYLPISPDYPADRKQYILTDSGASFLLTTPAWTEEIAKINIGQVETLFIDEGLASGRQGAFLKNRPQNLGDAVRLSQFPTFVRRKFPQKTFDEDQERRGEPVGAGLAYVIYTSGSTGKPKGVMIEHRSLVNRLFWMQKNYPIAEQDVIMQKTPIVFDVSLWELFWWSFRGAALCLLAPGDEKSPEAIIAAIAKNRVTTMHFVPSMFQVFLEHLESGVDPAALSSLRQVFCSGEALMPHQAAKFNKLVHEVNGTNLINLYGPTEATVDVSYYNCLPGEELESIPIGQPIDNIHLHVVNHELQLQPIGVPGELLIAGVGLARGYLNQPELTIDKFPAARGAAEGPSGHLERTPPQMHSEFDVGARRAVPGDQERRGSARFCVPPSMPSYRTGDLVRRLPGGNLEFLGRMDQQVKIRGFRIELGEIEERLAAHGDIKETLVLERTDDGGDPYLCAYIVAKNTKPELDNFLSQTLPDYMIPSFYIFLDEMPLTPNGKVDRRSLPASQREPGEEYRAPRTELEKKLASIWSRVLNIDTGDRQPIGIDATFFELGGHSLKAASLTAKIHKELDIRVPVAQIFKTSTIRSLAEFLSGIDREHYADIAISEKKEYYPLSPAQRRLFIYDQLAEKEKGIAYNMPNINLFHGTIDREIVSAVFNRLVARHDSLRTSFHMIAGEAVQRVADRIDFEVKKSNSSLGKAKKKIKEFIRPFDLSRAPLLRVELMSVGEEWHYIMFDMHHIISDGVSMEILMKEYEALYRGEEVEPLRIQYRDYASWQDKLSNEEELSRQESYWLDKLAGFEVTRLPRDHDEPQIWIKGKSESTQIGRSLYKKIEAFCDRHELTKFTFLIALFDILLLRETGRDDITLGVPAVNREHHDLKNLIGIFLNVLLIRSKVDRGDTFLNFLEQVKQTVFEAMDHNDYPYETLHAKIQERDRSKKDELFTIFVNYFKTDDDVKGVLKDDAAAALPETQELFPKYPIALIAADTGHSIKLNITYMSNLYSAYRIERILDNLFYIMNQVLKEENSRIRDIDIRDVHQYDDFAEEIDGEIDNEDLLF